MRDAQYERGAGVHDSIGRKLADHLLNGPPVTTRATGLECGAREAASLGDTARRCVELAADLMHAGDPTNAETAQNRPVSLRKAHRTGGLNLKTGLLYLRPGETPNEQRAVLGGVAMFVGRGFPAEHEGDTAGAAPFRSQLTIVMSSTRHAAMST